MQTFELDTLGTQLKIRIDTPCACEGVFLEIRELLLAFDRKYSRFIPGNWLDELNRNGGGIFPDELPLEMYCHSLSDNSILSDELNQKGFHTLTIFALHTPAKLFDKEPVKTKELAKQRALSALNQYLVEPIESCLANDVNGDLCIEVKSPIDLENEIFLPRGNIFHKDLSLPFKEDGSEIKWGVETNHPRVFLCGAGAIRGGGVSGIAGHNAAMAVLELN